MMCASCGCDMNGVRCACGWRAPIPVEQQPKTEVIHEPKFNREEFGLDLYECIKLCGARDQVRRYKYVDILHGRTDRLAHWNKQEKDLTAQVAEVIERLEPADQRRILQRFESEEAAWLHWRLKP